MGKSNTQLALPKTPYTKPSSNFVVDQDEILMLEIALEDLESVRVNEFGKLGDDNPIIVSLNDQKREYEMALQTMKDHIFCQSTVMPKERDQEALMKEFVVEDENLKLARIVQEELNMEGVIDRGQCSSSHQNKRRQSGVDTTNNSGTKITKLSNLLSDKFRVKGDCVSCGKENGIVWNAECNHSYCKECLTQIYVSTLQDFTLIPPKCCKIEFPPEWTQKLLSNAQQERYTKLSAMKFETNQAMDMNYVKMVRDKGWRICRECGAGVERIAGCNHMTCKCGHQFCYICELPWKPLRPCTCQY